LPGSFWGRTTTESHGHDVLLRVVVPVSAVGVLTALLRAAAANPGVLTAIGTPSAHVSEHLTLLMHAVDSEALKSVLESSGQAALLKAPEISVKLVGGESATSEGVAGLASLGIVATVAEYVTGYVRHE
jgi:acyl CoA:acetate/3-ketoacid CoA transferase